MRIHGHDETEAGRESARSPKADLPAVLLSAAQAGRPEVLGPAGLRSLQRAAGNEATSDLIGAAAAVQGVLGSGGEALAPEVRDDMESRLGADFSEVRVHTDAAAHRSAQSMRARAYTVGNDVVFQRDAWDPGSTVGRTTLAHELTHVIQQRSGPVEGSDAGDGLSVSDPSDRHEQEASANAERVMGGDAPLAAGDAGGGPVAALQRDELEEEEAQE